MDTPTDTRPYWQNLTDRESYYNIVTALQEKLAAGETESVAQGLEYFRKTMLDFESFVLYETLMNLMQDIILWTHLPESRVGERAVRILRLRDKYEDLLEDNPPLRQPETLENEWQDAWRDAVAVTGDSYEIEVHPEFGSRQFVLEYDFPLADQTDYLNGKE